MMINRAEEGVGKQGKFGFMKSHKYISGSAHRATRVSSAHRHAICCVSEILISPDVLCFHVQNPTTFNGADSSVEDSVSRKNFVSSVFDWGLGPQAFT